MNVAYKHNIKRAYTQKIKIFIRILNKLSNGFACTNFDTSMQMYWRAFLKYTPTLYIGNVNLSYCMCMDACTHASMHMQDVNDSNAFLPINGTHKSPILLSFLFIQFFFVSSKGVYVLHKRYDDDVEKKEGKIL